MIRNNHTRLNRYQTSSQYSSRPAWKRFVDWLRDDQRQPSRRGDWSRFVRDDEGLVTWITLIVLSFLLVFAAMVFNSAKVVSRKIEAQNSADACAISATTWTARGMNAITATNHLIGEINALYVLHHALGGKYLDEHSASDKNETRAMRSASSVLLPNHRSIRNPRIPAVRKFPDIVDEIPSADRNSMIYGAKLKLMREMDDALDLHWWGDQTYDWGERIKNGGGWFAAIGVAMMIGGAAMQAAAAFREARAAKEFLVLTGLEKLAHGMKRIKPILIKTIQALHIYQRAVQVACPIMSLRAAKNIGERHGGIGKARGDMPDTVPEFDTDNWAGTLASVAGEFAKIAPLLPIEHEDTTNEKRSQMMRATYPWVSHWRTGIVKFLRHKVWGAPTSGAPDLYLLWTNRYSEQASKWLRHKKNRRYRAEITIENKGDWWTQRGNGENGYEILMFVLPEINDSDVDKTQEIWNQRGEEDFSKATDRADELFCHMGFSKLKKPAVASNPFFRQSSPKGVICFAQSMLYNGNKQGEPEPTPGDGQPQPEAGWDTLGWTGNAIEFQHNNDQENAPTFKLNWQAKLTPVTSRKLIKTALTVADADMYARFYRIPIIITLKNH